MQDVHHPERRNAAERRGGGELSAVLDREIVRRNKNRRRGHRRK